MAKKSSASPSTGSGPHGNGATAPTEITVAGQPSAALLAELRRIGEKLTVKQLAKSLGHVEAARVGFVVEATATGILLLAKKQTIPHGGWQPFCAEVWGEIKGIGHGASDLDNFTRSLRRYCFLGQHFVADLEQKTFQPDGKTRAPELQVQPAEVLALDTLPQEKRIAVYGAIERWVAGRSLQRMLMDFRRAENAADQEEIEDANRRKKKAKAGDSNQMDFWEDMQRPITEIDTLMASRDVLETADKKFWLELAAALDRQAGQARALAKAAKK